MMTNEIKQKITEREKSWEAYLTDYERSELIRCRQKLSQLRDIGISRRDYKVPELTEIEQIELQIKRLQIELNKRGK